MLVMVVVVVEIMALEGEIDMAIVVVVRVEVVVDPEIMMMKKKMMKTIVEECDRAPSLPVSEVGLADDASSRAGILAKITITAMMMRTTMMAMGFPTILKR
jgi:hypothetical protein